MEQNEHVQIAIRHLLETWNELSQFYLKNPQQLASNQISYWQDYVKLCQPIPGPPTSDKRFQNSYWQDNLFFNFVKQFYFIASKQIETLIQDIAQNDADLAKKLRFYARQFIDATAPTNFANLNPEVLSKIAETNGANLITGFKQFIEDFARGNGQLNITMTDFDAFKLGENIACTPGKVIFQNALMQLIHYTPTTEKVYPYPLLIMPPWINKYYILDLQQENSLVQWLVDQGHAVFMISWVNPTERHRAKQFEDYMFEGPLAALDIVKQVTGEEKLNVLGYCIGGTLLGCTLAYLAKEHDTRINSATFLTSLLDFSEPGELGTFIDERQISLLESYMRLKGYLDGRVMAGVFNALRASDLIWGSFVNHYLKGQKPKAFDLLYWNADSTNIPEQVHSFYLRNMYLQNNLIQRNKIQMGGVPLDLSQVRVPSYFLAAEDDHIVPWRACYKSRKSLGGTSQFVLTSSGHVAGVVNPPHKNKYGYWINSKKPSNPEKYLSEATFHEGSWWNDWGAWLAQYSGKSQPAKQLNFAAIEDAPGSYVRVRLMKDFMENDSAEVE